MSERNDKNKIYYYLIFSISVVWAPLTYVVIYEQLAGGILNGFGGVYEKGTLSGEDLVSIVFPLLSLCIYGIILYRFIKYKKSSKIGAGAYLALVLSSLATVMVVSWSYIT